MADEGLKLRQKIGKAKAEEEIYEQFDEQGIGGVSDFLEDVKVKLTYTPLYRLRDAFHKWIECHSIGTNRTIGTNGRVECTPT